MHIVEYLCISDNVVSSVHKYLDSDNSGTHPGSQLLSLSIPNNPTHCFPRLYHGQPLRLPDSCTMAWDEWSSGPTIRDWRWKHCVLRDWVSYFQSPLQQYTQILSLLVWTPNSLSLSPTLIGLLVSLLGLLVPSTRLTHWHWHHLPMVPTSPCGSMPVSEIPSPIYQRWCSTFFSSTQLALI